MKKYKTILTLALMSMLVSCNTGLSSQTTSSISNSKPSENSSVENSSKEESSISSETPSSESAAVSSEGNSSSIDSSVNSSTGVSSSESSSNLISEISSIGVSSSESSSISSSEHPSIPGDDSKLMITYERGLNESVLVEWSKYEQANGYEVYSQAEGTSEWVKVDNELIREYPSYFRVDVLGLKEGNYKVKIVPHIQNAADESKAVVSSLLRANKHYRDGFAFKNGTASGGYNDDGTLKSTSVVFYVTNENASTISAEIVTDSKGTKTTAVGIQSIANLIKKSYDTRSFVFRFIGDVKTPANFSTSENSSISKGCFMIDGNKKYDKGITIEGVGNDAYADGWGITCKNITNFEVRNLGFIKCDSNEGDDFTAQQDNTHVWVHNCDFFYGMPGSDSDQAKGDGALDSKKSNYCTYSYNHFFDAGKCNLLGLSEGAYDSYITYDHNWYDHSDSRHPRVRCYSVHVYNNYYDGNAKYGMGACLGSSLFSEENYFRNCRFPMLAANQGRDYIQSQLPGGSSIFGKEAGGTIKAYKNIVIGGVAPIYYSETDNVDFDAYQVSSKEEKVPSTVQSKLGGNTYSNFDTDSSLMAESHVDEASSVPQIVTSQAGRMEQGDFKWTFTEADDTDYSVNVALQSALMNYTSQLVSVGGLK